MDLSTPISVLSGRLFRQIVPALAVVSYALLAGCATQPVPKGSRFVVSVPSAELYKNGPAQEPVFDSPQTSSFRTLSDQHYGPDAQLPKGASVTMLKREIGFSRVMTDEGVVGYVSNDQLQQAPTITRAATSSPVWKSNPAPRRNKVPQARPPEDHLDLSDVPLPLPS
jgi:hypothetical protein